MATISQGSELSEVIRLGKDIYARNILPQLGSADRGKIVAVDTITGEYEIDADELAAATRLKARLGNSKIYLLRVGHPGMFHSRGFR